MVGNGGSFIEGGDALCSGGSCSQSRNLSGGRLDAVDGKKERDNREMYSIVFSREKPARFLFYVLRLKSCTTSLTGLWLEWSTDFLCSVSL